MLKLLLSIFFICFYTFHLKAQSSENLSWTDFKGKVDESSTFAATLLWGVKYNYTVKFQGNTVKANVKSNAFLKDTLSWVKPGEQTESLLTHEKGHLKIGELLSMEFMTEIKRNSYTKADYRFKIDSIFKSLLKTYIDLELDYDEDTDHSLDTHQQEKWNLFLEERKHYFKDLIEGG